MFHKLMWQHMQDAVGFLITTLKRNLPEKKTENRLRFDRIMVMSLWPYLFWPTLILRIAWLQRN